MLVELLFRDVLLTPGDFDVTRATESCLQQRQGFSSRERLRPTQTVDFVTSDRRKDTKETAYNVQSEYKKASRVKWKC